MKGTVKRFFGEKGYGFVDGNDGQSYFLHIKQIRDQVIPKDGDEVKFDGVETEKGKQAHNVMVM